MHIYYLKLYGMSMKLKIFEIVLLSWTLKVFFINKGVSNFFEGPSTKPAGEVYFNYGWWKSHCCT